MIQDGLLHLYVLAGGMSSRFGAEKALAVVDGTTMLEGVITAIKPAIVRKHRGRMGKITLVTGTSQRFQSLGHRVITDRPEGVGPIGGLNAALIDRLIQHGPGWLLLASCDLVRPQASWIDALVHETRGKKVTAVAFYADRWEPMLALYHTDLFPIVETQISRKQYSLQYLLTEAQALRVPLPPGIPTIPQANTPQQLEEALLDRHSV